MNKLRMDLDALQVESFDASPAGAYGPGTVNARSWTVVETIEPQKPTLDDSNCPIYSCGCSAPGQLFTECECNTLVPGPLVTDPRDCAA
jgi:hypothetical protein